jgi:hypothetical protein
LCVEHQTASIDQVGKHAAREGEDETGRRGHEGVESEPERRVGQIEDEPTLRDRLHPGADIRKKRAGPEETIVAIRKSAEHSAAAASGHEGNSLNTIFVICGLLLLPAPGGKGAAAAATACGDDFGEDSEGDFFGSNSADVETDWGVDFFELLVRNAGLA